MQTELIEGAVFGVEVHFSKWRKRLEAAASCDDWSLQE